MYVNCCYRLCCTLGFFPLLMKFSKGCIGSYCPGRCWQVQQFDWVGILSWWRLSKRPRTGACWKCMCLHCSAITTNIYIYIYIYIYICVCVCEILNYGFFFFSAPLYVFGVASCVVLACNRSCVHLNIIHKEILDVSIWGKKCHLHSI